MSTTNRITIPPRAQRLHTQLKQELLEAYTPISAQQTSTSFHTTTSNTQSLYNKISRGGYFRPKESEPPVQPLNVYPNYMKRDPREYPPIHCCPWKPQSTAEDIKTIREEVPRTKHVHHTLFDARRYTNATESPTIRSMNKTVFGRTMKTPINLLATDSMQFDIPTPEKVGTRIEILEQLEESPLQVSGVTSLSKIMVPVLGKGIEAPRHSRRASRSDASKGQKVRERFEETQNDFRKTLVRIDAIARKRRSWYQENMEEKTELMERLKDGGKLLKSMDSLSHKAEIRQAVRLSAVHSHYEKNWARLRNVRGEKEKEKQVQVQATTTRLRTLLMENKDEMSRVLSFTPDPVKKKQGLMFY